MTVGISYADWKFRAKAEILAHRHGFLLADKPDGRIRLWLNVDDNGVSLIDVTGKLGALRINFNAGGNYYRYLGGGCRSERLYKAVGLAQTKNCNIIDATAGFGKDAFLLACCGANVSMIEQNPAVAVLLQDALDRAESDDKIDKIVCQRMQLEIGDAKDILDRKECKEIIYLDPMYPYDKKRRLPTGHMQYLRLLTENQEKKAENTLVLFYTAMANAKRRVIVKRPLRSMPICDDGLSYQISGKTTRFDIYLI